jgi:8-oxo-dGTP diphosphatase
VDVVAFRRARGRLEVLLIKRGNQPFEGQWSLPGGFVEENEPLETAAARELEEETGLSGLALEQIGAFGDPGRDPRGHTVAIAFVGLAGAQTEVAAADDAADARWCSARRPPELAFDHAKILRAALARFLASKQMKRVRPAKSRN